MLYIHLIIIGTLVYAPIEIQTIHLNSILLTIFFNLNSGIHLYSQWNSNESARR